MHADARSLLEMLQLQPHPEGGFFREVFRSPLTLALPRGSRATCTAIWFLLPAGTFSALHRVRSDEVWNHHDGDPLDLHLLDDAGGHRVVRLGHDYGAGETSLAVVPAGVWQAAVPRGDRFSLCACTVAPGFDFADFQMPPRDVMLRTFPQHLDLVTALTR